MSLDDLIYGDIQPRVSPPETFGGTAKPAGHREDAPDVLDAPDTEIDPADCPEDEAWPSDDVDESAADPPVTTRDPATFEAALALARAERAFYNHLFGEARRNGCCRAPVGHYCPAGAELKRAYEDAAARDIPFAYMPAAYKHVHEEQ